MYLFGANGHGKVVAEIAELNNLNIQGFIDENPEKQMVWEYAVCNKIPENIEKLFLSVGNNLTRKKLYERYSSYEYPTLVHPTATISKRSTIGKGTVVMASASVNPNCTIGKQVILNTSCSIDHDCNLEDFVHISPNAALAGNVSVGEGTQIGIGASVIQGIKIGKWAMIGAGAVIIRDVPDNAVVVGNPGKVIRT